MPCGHWLGARRVATLARITGLPIVAARRCDETVVLASGEKLSFNFKANQVRSLAKHAFAPDGGSMVEYCECGYTESHPIHLFCPDEKRGTT